MKTIDVLGYELNIPYNDDEFILTIEKKDYISVYINSKFKDGTSGQRVLNVQAECGCTSDEFIDEFNKLNK